jgi:arginyl-tRNA synthetase
MNNLTHIISSVIHWLYGIDFTPEISPAPKPELGEYCVNIFPIVKQAGKAPNIISEEVAKELAKSSNTFRSTSATGGYVNFFLADSVWLELFRDIVSGEQVKPGKKGTIVVDYIGANVGKPLHIGHICTPSIGQTICNVYEHLGYKVIGDSHFGDWGGIFGKLIWGWKFLELKHITSEWADKYEFLDSPVVNREELLIKLLEVEWVNLLLRIYQQFHLVEWEDLSLQVAREWQSRQEFQYLSWINTDLSNSEENRLHEENVELWKKFTSISITETEKKLSLLNVFAKYNIGESFYEGLGLPRPNGEDYPALKWNMKDIVEELCNNPKLKWIVEKNDDGSVWVTFPDEYKLPSCILQKKDGTGLYLTSDLAAIKYRLTNGWNPEKIIYSVDVRQQLHLRQAFTIAKMAWWEEFDANNVEFTHAHNGFIKLKEGAMSTRHGTVIFLQALIDEGNERTENILEEKWRTGEKPLSPSDIEAITVWAIKYSYLAQDREKDVTFDWDKALNFEGNSGPYIQYACVRAKKIIGALAPDFILGKVATQSQSEISSYDKSLIQMLLKFDEVVGTVAKTYKPHHLALYAYDLAVAFNSFYVHTPKILEEKDETLRNLRLSLVKKSSETLEKAFALIGIKMPSEM